MPRSNKLSGNFASGIALPVRADSDGGITLAEGEEYVQQLVLTAMQSHESDNPFQDLGITDQAVFEVSADPTWQVFMRRRIVTQMRILERDNLAKLIRVDFGTGQNNGDFPVEVTYRNLETQQENSFTAVVGADGDVDLRPI